MSGRYLHVPGPWIVGAQHTPGLLNFFGTSAVASHVAGAIALLKSRAGLCSYDQIVRILYGQALDLGSPGGDNRYGAGRLSIDS